MTSNNTKKQHFVTRAEMRLNACQDFPGTIYRLEVVDPAQHSYLVPRRRSFIETTLMFEDLFSFGVEENDRLRENLEADFTRYESMASSSSVRLVGALRNGTDAFPYFVHVLMLKLLNFFRNPYNWKKILNTFSLEKRDLTDETRVLVEKLMSGSRPHEIRVAERFGMPLDAYRRWLRTLLILVTERGQHNLPLIEEITVSLLNNHYLSIHVNLLDDDSPHCCALSDRGVVILDQEPGKLAYEFNVTSKAHIYVAFVDVSSLAHGELAGNVLASAVFENLRGKGQLSVQKNDLARLELFNKRAVFQSAEAVYASSSQVFGVNAVESAR